MPTADKVYLSAPIAKTVETPDGGREVWGFATLEVVDKSGEIADFEGTKESFEKWSQDVEKRTGGKSKGNVRLMHQPITAGKMVHWEPAETTIQDQDGNSVTVKAIWTGAYIPPTKPDVIKDIDEGILSALSIGGSYKKRWYDDQAKAFRFIPELSEYSLVDNPCVPGADISQVIQKADAPWNSIARNIGGESVSEEVEKQAAKPEGSFEERSQQLQDACENKFKQPGQSFWDGYVVATWDDHVIVRDWTNNAYWDIPYTVDDEGCISLGDPAQVDKVESYIPVETMKMVKATEDERKKLHDAADARANKYGIAFKDGKGHLTPPKGKPTDPEQYGDPVNFAYPIDSEHIESAVSYFNQDGQQKDGGYSEDEWAKIGKRISEAASKAEGGEYKYKDGKIETPSQKKEAEKSVTLEQLQKAAEEAGLTAEQVTSFFNGLTKFVDPTEPTAPPTDVTEVDGDGDGDKNKEFPNPPEGDEKVDIESGQNSVKDAEKEVGVDIEAEKSAGGDLAKAGKAISNARMLHLQHATNHIKAAMDGTDYGPDEHMQIENDTAGDGPNSGLEAPEVTQKTFTSELKKSFGVSVSEEVNKAVGGLKGELESLIKGMASQESLQKFTDRFDAIEEMVKAIHDTPQSAGPVLNGGSEVVARMLKSGNPEDLKQASDEALSEFAKSIKDPNLRQKVGEEIALRQMRGVLGGNA